VTDANIAYQHLMDAVLKRHAQHRESDDPEIEEDFFEFSEAELRRIVESLWVDRYSGERKTFKDTVGAIVSEKISEE
jgi:hypothetical protein